MKIQKIVLILFSIIPWINTVDLIAQEGPAADPLQVEQVKEELFQEISQDRNEPYRPAWQKDFDAIRLKSSEQMAQSLKLSIEQKNLQREIEKLTEKYRQAQDKNQELQAKIRVEKDILDEKKWKAKVAEQDRKFKEEQAVKSKELEKCRKDLELLQRKIDVTRLKLKMMGVEDLSDARLALQQERNFLEASIISNEEKIKDLTEKISAVKSRGMKMDPEVAQLKTEIESARKNVQQMEEKQGALKGTTGRSLQETLEILRRQKADVEKSSDEVKAKVLKYKNAQKMGIENNRVKELVEIISAVDSANNKLNDEITYLTENITILKVRIKRMEYKQESMKTLKGKSQEMAP